MKIEKQVCSIEQAKRLKELGVNQDSLWYHSYYVNPQMIGTEAGIIHKSLSKERIEDNEGDEFDIDIASAFTVSELVESLPIGTYNFAKDADSSKTSLAEVMANYLITGIEKNVIGFSIEEINKRLSEAG